MTRKEALERINDSITENCRPCSCSDCVENGDPCLEYRAFKQIEKDLEVLEILKNEYMILTQDTILKVKEWLNDK